MPISLRTENTLLKSPSLSSLSFSSRARDVRIDKFGKVAEADHAVWANADTTG
jgi:hypothetical protein